MSVLPAQYPSHLPHGCQLPGRAGAHLLPWVWPLYRRPMRLLFVCTGNMCRSPLAERLTSSWAERALGASAARVRISSAGTNARDGHEMDATSAAVLADLGGDSRGFSARTLVPEHVMGADLVLTMSRRHRHEVLKHAPRALRRTFTLAEAAALYGMADVTGIAPLPLEKRATEMAARLDDARRLRRTGPDDDIFDPINKPLEVHQAVGAHIEETLRSLVGVLFARSPVLPIPHPRAVART
jgi:protein-tyrosine phosphatase